jgi:hypothetical protein
MRLVVSHRCSPSSQHLIYDFLSSERRPLYASSSHSVQASLCPSKTIGVPPMDISSFITQAQSRLLREGQQPPTVVVAFTDASHVVTLTFPFLPGTSDRRASWLFMRGRLFATQYGRQHIRTIWFVHESWLTTSSSLRPSHDRQRREVLMALELDASPTTKFAQLLEVSEILRTHSGKVKAVERRPEYCSEEVAGEVVGEGALAFLAGFAECCSHPDAYRGVQTRLLWHRHQMDRWFGPHS